MRFFKIIALSAIMAAPLPALADEAPSADAVRQVMSYYRDGSNVILVEAKLCKEVVKEGDNKNDCAEEIADGKLTKGDKAFVWLNFFVPGDNTDTSTVLVQFSSKGMVQQSNTVRMKQTTRYRTWYTLPTNKAGDWEVAASQEQTDSYLKLGGLSYTVEEAKAETPAQ